MKKIIIKFEGTSDKEIIKSIIERFLMEYPESKHNTNYVNETLSFNYSWNTIEDIDTFLCEEICHEFEVYCYIIDSQKQISKEYYYDEEDEWSIKYISK